jgi:uncharacterized membrane protein YhhN
MRKIILVVFILAAAAALGSAVSAIYWLHSISKPMIMASLMVYYLTSSESINRSAIVILGMIFSLAGDILLLNADYFIAGLIAFLVAHVLYIFSYRQHRHEDAENALHGLHRARLAFPIILAGTGLIVVLYPVLGDLRVPVIFYAAVLVMMVINALFRYGRTSSKSFWMVFAGAVLFMVSDSTLAIDKFLLPISYAPFWIMLTYIGAQFLIIEGLTTHFVRNSEGKQKH